MLERVAAAAADYRRDGVACLTGVLDEETQARVREVYAWSLAHPTPSGCQMFAGTDGAFYQDLSHPAAAHAYRSLLTESIIADIAAVLWDAPEVWFLYEQIWLKEAGTARRTPWHQDTPYLAVEGDHVAVFWINLDAVPAAQSLEFVRGSWRGTLYDGSAFDAADDTAPVYGTGLPRLPDIEADRAAWDIVRWDVGPADVIVFHPSTLHGGGATRDGVRRRTLSLRLFGRDAVFAARPGLAPAPLVAGLDAVSARGTCSVIRPFRGCGPRRQDSTPFPRSTAATRSPSASVCAPPMVLAHEWRDTGAEAVFPTQRAGGTALGRPHLVTARPRPCIEGDAVSLLAGRRVVITGSSRGLGRACAVEMARHGAAVVLNGTDAAALTAAEQAVRTAGGRCVAVAGSVAESALCERLVQTCVETFGGIDLLVNNAGLVRDRTLFKMSDAEFDEVIAVHLRGTWAASKYAALAMREAGGGHIINVVSNSGLSGGFGQSNYAAAKAGMMGLLRTWVLELARYGIRCNAFWPIAETDMTQVVFANAARAAESENRAPPSPAELGFGTATEVAQGLVWLASAAAERFNGQCLTFNGRKTALWTHPREVHETFREQPFTLADLDAHYAGIEPEPIVQPRFVP
ncbi:MAG: SDR family NAD(P)-dependent oxidoreductase [Gammaproteobacteria bacterium]